MATTDVIEQGFKKALRLLKKKKDNMDLLPEAVATFLLVHSAQGVIDNGGYRYFFESNWPGNPPYSRFIQAYKAIGCDNQAADFGRVADTFPFEAPHLDEEGRNKYMDENLDEEEYAVKGWEKNLCGDEEVWRKLEAFYTTHASDFA